ncbi:putative membrane protein [Enterobacter roggenkampii]|nr:putative membrane protein [Escherichia coli 2-156-04_S4_C2]PRW40859.1 putative membrane protein [Enterobacter roggenkampii]
MIPGEENIKFFVKDIVINAVVMMGYKFINNMYKLFLLR